MFEHTGNVGELTAELSELINIESMLLSGRDGLMDRNTNIVIDRDEMEMEMEMETGSGLRLCRFCMGHHDLLDIFRHEQEIKLDFKALECNLAVIRKNDGLPSFICKSCEKRLNQCYEFKLQCVDTVIKLKKIIKSEINVMPKKEFNVILEEIKCEPDFFTDYEDNELIIEQTKNSKLKKKQKKRINRKMSKRPQRVKENYIYKASTKIEDLLKDFTNDTDVKVLDSSETMPKLDKSSVPIDLRVLNLSQIKPEAPLKPFQCEQCGVTFKLKSILKKHFMTHSSEKRFPCLLCPKRYTREEHRVVHMRSHEGVRPYVCEICARSFTKSQDLIRHKRIHNDEKNYPCMRCDKKFKRSSDVKAHMRTHTGARPYTCKGCYKTYTYTSGLRKHQNTCDKHNKDC